VSRAVEPGRDPVLIGRPADAELADQLLAHFYGRRAAPTRSRWWLVAWLVAGALTVHLVICIAYTVWTGIGVWGNNIPVGWAFAITNFVWWIGIGHAGTFISAILLLLEQRWRTSINRAAEAMTLFAVIQAALFPLLHLGRPWFFYWLFPYPARMGVWPQWKSALPWDAAAVSTYFTVSLLFWYLGLLPDLAKLRDRAPTRARRIAYGIFALGWRGSARALRHYRIAYGLLAGLATPLVVSVHSIVSSDFAIALVPGWHSTIFPPYFVAGAIFSGFAMVLTLLVPVRRLFKLQAVITRRHLDNMAKMLLVTGWVVAYAYLVEAFLAWYSGDPFDEYNHFISAFVGPRHGVYLLTVCCNVLVPQILWFRRARTSEGVLFVASLLINVGMWSERFSIIVLSLQRDFLPSAWATFTPTWVDWGILAGTIGFFSLLFLCFLKWVPFIPVAELTELKHELSREGG
jgi:molybdopterin-containing oxidoreductase family membrane subunit